MSMCNNGLFCEQLENEFHVVPTVLDNVKVIEISRGLLIDCNLFFDSVD